MLLPAESAGFSRIPQTLLCLGEFEGKGDEVPDAEPFGTEIEDGVGYEPGSLFRGQPVFLRHCRDERLQGISQSLSPLVEGSFHYGFEKGLIASEIFSGVPSEPDDGGFYFRRGVERTLSHSEQIFYVIPGLEQD